MNASINTTEHTAINASVKTKTSIKTAYVALSADFLHEGHLNIIKKASELGRVVVGVLTDSAVASYKRLPLLDLAERKLLAENLKLVDQVVVQDCAHYRDVLPKLKPDYVVHGDNWLSGHQNSQRASVMEMLEGWGGELVEIPYSSQRSSCELAERVRQLGTTPSQRLSHLRRLLRAKNFVRAMEVHNGLTGLIVESTSISTDQGIREFDAMWESSLTDSTSKGKPDTGSVDFTNRASTIDQVMEVTTKPMIVDADNGGLTEHFMFTVRTLERQGVSAVIIEDKIGPKRNSLFGTAAAQEQDDTEVFASKISAGKKAQVTEDFMIIARVESLILQRGLDDALTRAFAYVEAGADGIMIHSRHKDPSEILEFCKLFRAQLPQIPLVVVPTSFATCYEHELIDAGVNIVIYANHMLRSAYPAMQKVAETILQTGRSHEADNICMPIKEIITLIPSECA